MISNKIMLLKDDANPTSKLAFKKGMEFHIVMDVVYMQGFPLPPSLQGTMYSWLEDNPELFKEIYR